MFMNVIDIQKNSIAFSRFFKGKLQNNQSTQFENFDYLKNILKSKKSLIFSKNILILDIEALYKFMTYPKVREKELKLIIKNSLEDIFPINILDYTISYRILETLDKNINVLFCALKTEMINKYMSLFKGITVHYLDLRQNFSNIFLGNLDKGNITNVTLNTNLEDLEEVNINFIENGILKFIVKSDYTNLDRIFSPYISIYGQISIEKAYIQKGTDEILINYIKNHGVEIIFYDDLFKNFEIPRNIDKIWG
ncbi:MAG: hypothetical protein FWF57_05825 [Defluviitaleaceae bacterium]|nr:hypothetical protein [Defluviitaleaceae bacterium]